ncbi:FHA domain-containing protein [Rhizohabitans arisaemae]|uniref:FHA domain-containing protein n=1 Tax=Rhizohabitans arisaemae TaxID=2720610 RepID=UPI0024B11C08|nr:FHA domain-containing protein [Rhizohabitans arisaemae]
MPSVYCTRCGHANSGDARFCSNCGSPLSRYESIGETTSTISLSGFEPLDPPESGTAIVGEHGSTETLHPGTALLVVMRGPNAGSRFLLNADLTTAGRHPESDIFLDDITVSRRHAEFYRRGDVFTVRDVGSHNGSYVNRERIEEVVLSGGDEVQIGKFRLVFLVRGAGGP